jgi:hypothetical protein
VAIQYCPTKEMVADYFTKPLQGELFYKFRDQIMGVVPMDTITGNHRSVLDEKSNHPASSEKPKRALQNNARSKSAHLNRKTGAHHSWADVVKSKSPKDSSGRLTRAIIKQ